MLERLDVAGMASLWSVAIRASCSAIVEPAAARDSPPNESGSCGSRTCGWASLAVSTAVNMPAILMVVNIEFHRYHRHDMAKSNDPDIQLRALADLPRMEILQRELAGAPEVCACDFTSCCDVSQPTVSHHLKVLRDAGVVVSERRGNWPYKIPNLGDRLAGITGGLVPGAGVLISTLAARAARARAGTVVEPIQLSPRPS